MLQSLLGLIGLGGPEYETRTLARDARAMIEMVNGQHGPDSLAGIAEKTRTQIDAVHTRGLNDVQYYGRGVEELTELNRAARRRRDNIAWSGITLAVIYIKAEILGEPGLPARNIVDGFIERWRRADGDTPRGDAPEATAPDC